MVNPVKQQVADFDIYDVYYSGKSGNNYTRDSNIVIIQIADKRADIAAQISKISSLEPAIIGIDVTFAPRNDSIGNPLLLEALKLAPNTICSYQVLHQPGHDALTISASQVPQQKLASDGGYINFIGQRYSVVRYYSPFINVDGQSRMAFSSKIIERYSPPAFESLKKRDKEIEIINYERTIDNYHHYTREELNREYNQLKNIVKGKIVLLGFFSKSPVILEDLKFTPLNEVVAGKSDPDTYGVVVHANILSMILSGNYASLMPEWFSYVAAFVFTFIFSWYVIALHKKKEPAHWKLVIVQVTGIILLTYGCLLFFSSYQVKIHLLPIVVSLIFSLELLGVYRSLALWLHKKFNYETVFSIHAHH